jgi:hypothetical protein
VIATHVNEVAAQPLWAILLALAFFGWIFLIFIRYQLKHHQDPPLEIESMYPYRIFIVAADVQRAYDWCHRYYIDPRDPNVRVITLPHRAEGYEPNPEDYIIDLGGPRSEVRRLEEHRRV